MATRDKCCTLVSYFKVHDGKLAHLDNVGALLREALKIADITRL